MDNRIAPQQTPLRVAAIMGVALCLGLAFTIASLGTRTDTTVKAAYPAGAFGGATLTTTATSTRTPGSVSTITLTPTATHTLIPGCSPAVYASTNVPVVIVDNSTVDSTITVSDTGNIAFVEVLGIDITHTVPPDLDVFLFIPDGTSVRLFVDSCATGGGWTSANTRFNLADNANTAFGLNCPPGPYTFVPSQDLTRIRDRPAAGTWTLRITDDAANGQAGTLNGWGLRIYTGPCATHTRVPVYTVTTSPTRTPSPTSTPIGGIPTSTVTLTPINTPTTVATNTPGTTNTPGATHTRTVTVTGTPPTATITPTSGPQSPTATTTPTITGTPPTATNTPTFGPQSPTSTTTPTITGTPPTSTVTRTPGSPTNTRTITRTRTTSPTVTSPTTTPLISPTVCSINFTDVSPNDYFYVSVSYLYCAGVISGYADGTFRPYNDTTRGQLSKIIVLARGWDIDTTGGPHFSDVPTNSTFYGFIETAYNRGVISGYGDGTFRPGNNVTRGQLCKIIVLAMEWPLDTTGGPHFSDVPTTSTFFNYIETVYNRGVISGYGDGTFRPGNNALRGQICKIVYNAISE